jgi:hypothetical protein
MSASHFYQQHQGKNQIQPQFRLTINLTQTLTNSPVPEPQEDEPLNVEQACQFLGEVNCIAFWSIEI